MQAKSHLEASQTTVPNAQEKAVHAGALKATSQVLAAVPHKVAATSGGVKQPDAKNKESSEERLRREAFFRAMAQKAAAEFKAMPYSA
jgi:hypothetical protein